MKRKIVIIGAGLGGLVTGYLLTKRGDQVTLIEHDKHPGGCLQSFYREGIRFDTGFHFVGGMAKGGPLYRFFRELGLTSLPWTELKEQEIWIGNRCFSIPTGEKRWLTYMSQQFPHQKENLKTLLTVCKKAVECPFTETMPYWETNAWNWLCQTIDDPLLRDVISGSSLLVELNRETLPLFAFAEIVYSYIYSSHKLKQGGQLIIDHLLGYITSKGGEVHCSSTVTRILEEDGRAVGVQLQDGTTYSADIVLSAIHPVETMNLLSENTSMRKIYQRRVRSQKDSMGCFTANIKMKKGCDIEMHENPIYIHREGTDFWKYDTLPINHLLVHFYPDQCAMDFITPVAWDNVKQWEGTSVGQRGEDYELFKQDLLNQCITLSEQVFPTIRQHIDQVWTSTPLTWQNYLLSHNGTAYGICKNCNSPETTLLLPRTPLKGLYLTGQSIILHGIMGTTISGFITAEFLKQQ